MTKIYGIRNCDTMKKAFKWLDLNQIEYEFHDYKKSGIDKNAILDAINQYGWENIINKRGTTWRKLPKATQSSVNDSNACDIAEKNPSALKRPLLLHREKYYLGFNEDQYQSIFFN